MLEEPFSSYLDILGHPIKKRLTIECGRLEKRVSKDMEMRPAFTDDLFVQMGFLFITTSAYPQSLITISRQQSANYLASEVVLSSRINQFRPEEVSEF
jgi:hypothetical protein